MSTLISVLFGLFLDGESLDRAIELHRRASELPDVRAELIAPTVAAALTAETPEFPAELLIAIAWGESRFEPGAHTGRACGPMQTIARTGDCERWRDPFAGFQAGVDELTQWSRDRRTHHELRLILGAYACGNSIFDGTCTKTRWPSWVLARAKRLGLRDVRPAS